MRGYLGHAWRTRLAPSGVAVLACLASAQSVALGLGDPAVSSALGQPLRITVPLVVDPDVELTQECVRLVQVPDGGDAVPALGAARVLLDTERSQLRIESVQAVDEPVLRVAVEVGCAQRIRREFTLLLDPPMLSAPVAGAPMPVLSAPAPSIGLGMAQISAVLGQRLTMKVPVTGADAASLRVDCVRLADPISGEGAPMLRQAQISVGQQDGVSQIDLVSSEPVNEPAVRVALDVGCVEPLRREYAILLGLPALAAAGEDRAMPDPVPVAPVRRAAKAAARPAPKPAPASAPVASIPAAVAAPASAAEAAIPEKRPARPADRLVLASTPDPASAAEAQAVQNADLARRLDEMARQLQSLNNELTASRARVQELERRAAESRESWTWFLAALGGVLLGAALTLAWRHRRSSASAWEAVRAPAPQPGASPALSSKAQRSGRIAPGIGGRGSMAPAPTTVGAVTEPTLPDDRPTEITVTELHDTVQVIKELYATVLERNSTSVPGTDGRPERPLELDLNAPTGGNGMGPRATVPVTTPAQRVVAETAAGPGTSTAAPRPRAPGSAGLPTRRRSADTEAAQDESFTELPTEMGIDLDLGSLTIAPPQSDPAPLNEPSVFAGRASKPVPAAQDPGAERVPVRAIVNWKEPAAGRTSPGELPVSAAGAPFAEEHLTQSPTELNIDLDVGVPSRLGDARSSQGGAVLPLSRAAVVRNKDAALAPAPVDLKLDLPAAEARDRSRGDRSA
jgi:hypothetical protein